MAKLKTIFGQRVKSLRQTRGLTQEALGRSVGVDYKHIGAIERGVRAPSFDVIERLATALKCDWYQFFLPVESRKIDLEGEITAVLGSLDERRRKTLTRLVTEIIRAARKLDKP